MEENHANANLSIEDVSAEAHESVSMQLASMSTYEEVTIFTKNISNIKRIIAQITVYLIRNRNLKMNFVKKLLN